MRITTKLAIVIIVILVFVFLYQMVALGKVPQASDVVARRPIGKWAEDYTDTHGNIPQWFPHLFGGMPSYGGYIYTPSDPTKTLLSLVVFTPGVRYLVYFLIGGIGMFFFLRRRDLGQVPSVFGALVFALTPYMFGLITPDIRRSLTLSAISR